MRKTEKKRKKGIDGKGAGSSSDHRVTKENKDEGGNG